MALTENSVCRGQKSQGSRRDGVQKVATWHIDCEPLGMSDGRIGLGSADTFGRDGYIVIPIICFLLRNTPQVVFHNKRSGSEKWVTPSDSG